MYNEASQWHIALIIILAIFHEPFNDGKNTSNCTNDFGNNL